MLRLDGKRLRLRLAEARTLPDPVERLQPEVASQGFLDHLAVALAGPAAFTFTALRTSCSIVSVVRPFATKSLRHLEAVTACLQHGQS